MSDASSGPQAEDLRLVRADALDRGDTGSERSEVLAAVTRFVVVGMVTVLVLAVPAALLMQHLVRAHTLEELETSTLSTATNLFAPLIDEEVMAGDAEAVRPLARIVSSRIADGSVLRISVWDRSRRVLFSTSDALIGRQFPAHDWTDRVLVDGLATAVLEDDGEPDNLYEHGGGRYVEVDAPFVAASGDELVLEIYYPASVVHVQQRDLLLRLLPVGLATLVVLQLAQLPPAVQLARRIQRLESGRRRLMRHAVAASDLERRRIAGELHDDVIQELAGASYALESVESRLAPADQALVERTRAILRGNVRRLRSMLVQVYPADLRTVGLATVLDRLAERLRADGIDVRVDVPDDLGLDETSTALAYRVAREAMANAYKHSHATEVSVTVIRHGSAMVLEVADDGVGFDPDQATPPVSTDTSRRGDGQDPTYEARAGHLGLRLVRDTVAEAGGNLEVASTPGSGTRLTATIPLP